MSETKPTYQAGNETADTHIRGLSKPLVRELRKLAIDRDCNLAVLVNQAIREYLERHVPEAALPADERAHQAVHHLCGDPTCTDPSHMAVVTRKRGE